MSKIKNMLMDPLAYERRVTLFTNKIKKILNKKGGRPEIEGAVHAVIREFGFQNSELQLAMRKNEPVHVTVRHSELPNGQMTVRR